MTDDRADNLPADGDECLDALARAARRWSVRLDGAPLRSPTSCVAFGRLSDGGGAERQVVVKVARPGSDEGLAGAALRHFDGRGSVRLLADADGATLLERLHPGHLLAPLVAAGRDDEATAVVCDVARALHAPAPPGVDLAFPTVV